MTKREKVTKEEWEDLGIKTRVLRKMLFDYAFDLDSLFGKSDVLTRDANKLFSEFDQLRSDLDDVCCHCNGGGTEAKDVIHLFYGHEFVGNQKQYLDAFVERSKLIL